MSIWSLEGSTDYASIENSAISFSVSDEAQGKVIRSLCKVSKTGSPIAVFQKKSQFQGLEPTHVIITEEINSCIFKAFLYIAWRESFLAC